MQITRFSGFNIFLDLNLKGNSIYRATSSAGGCLFDSTRPEGTLSEISFPFLQWMSHLVVLYSV